MVSSWFFDHYIEVCGALTGFLYLVFSIRQHFLTWPVGLINAIFYIVVFFSSKIYADMTLQFYYVGISIYGWWCWYHGSETGDVLEVSRTHLQLWIRLGVATFVLFALLAFVLLHYTDTQVPYWDAVTTALSVVATWMLAKKKLEHWLVWIFVDFFSMGLFLYKALYPTALLFLAYTVLAFLGYSEWKKELKRLA